MYLLYLTTVYFMRIADRNRNRAFPGPQSGLSAVLGPPKVCLSPETFQAPS